MAVIEIAKIQVRRGQENQTGVPQLAGGEFAWAADTEKLYIGLKIEDGGSRDANVRVLTETDYRELQNLFAAGNFAGYTETGYVYRSGTNITAPDGFTEEFERTIQQKLDDFVNVLDFGAVGDGVSDDSAAIQRAVDRIFLGTLVDDGNGNYLTVPTTSKTLYFPVGTYKLMETIYIPRNTTLIGEGIDKTYILQTSSLKHAFQTCDADSVGGTTGYITFDTVDNTISSAGRPRNIRIENMTIQYAQTLIGEVSDQALSLVSLDCAPNSTISNVKFVGSHVINDNTTSDYAGVDLRGFSEISSEGVSIHNCEFNGLYLGIKSNYDVPRTHINNSLFLSCVRGISFNDPKDGIADVGPSRALIENNTFQNIELEAIHVGTTDYLTFHTSQNNKFLNNIGAGNAASVTGTAIIKFLGGENISVNDHFYRFYEEQQNFGSTTPFYPMIFGRSTIDSASVRALTLNSTGVNTDVIKLPITGFAQGIELKYSLSTPTLGGDSAIDRMGVLSISVRQGADPAIVITDNYTYTSNEGLYSWKYNGQAAYGYFEIFIESAESSESNAATILEFQTKIMY
jgi:hypothetical protein